MISVFGWPNPNTGFDQSEHSLYTCYFINTFVLFLMNMSVMLLKFLLGVSQKIFTISTSIMRLVKKKPANFLAVRLSVNAKLV